MSKNIGFRYEVLQDDCRIVREIVASTGFFSPVEIEVAVELVEERLAKGPLSGYHFVFAERGGEMLGYTCYGPIALTAASYDLFWIAVNKDYQGQKIGRILLEKSEELILAAGGTAGVYRNLEPRAIRLDTGILPPLRLPRSRRFEGFLRSRR